MTAFHDWSLDTEKVGLHFHFKLPHPGQSNIYLHLKDIFIKLLHCLDFWICLLEFNIFNITNYMQRKNKKFRKISLMAPTSDNEALSSLLISSVSLLIEERDFISSASCGIFIDYFRNWGAIKKALRILYTIGLITARLIWSYV